VFSYKPPKYKHSYAYVYPSWRWNGLQAHTPTSAVSFSDSSNDFILAAFWPTANGTKFSLFPLGSGDERLSDLPITNLWKQSDASLTAVGVIPGGAITLAAPSVSNEFFAEVLNVVGFPPTTDNIEMIGRHFAQQFLVKAYEFMTVLNPENPEQFIQEHQYSGEPAVIFCQTILNDLAAWDPQVLPYIQDLPMRIRAILLEVVDIPTDTVWSKLTR
jgi:hypothetical protein